MFRIDLASTWVLQEVGKRLYETKRWEVARGEEGRRGGESSECECECEFEISISAFRY